MEQEFAQAVAAAAGREEVRRAVREVYAAVQEQVDARQPVCVASGRCCHFEEYGHRLYVTTLELACFVQELPRALPQPTPPPGMHSLTLFVAERSADWDGRGCPYQVNDLCGVHAVRPFGCRMFFCDASSTVWQNEQYERFHAELKRLHEALGVPYFYVEWRQALRALKLDELSLLRRGQQF